jgi:hypothetical protein
MGMANVLNQDKKQQVCFAALVAHAKAAQVRRMNPSPTITMVSSPSGLARFRGAVPWDAGG